MANRGSASKRFSKLIRYFNFQQRTVVDPVTQQETIEEVPVLENVSLEASTDVTVSGKQVVTTASQYVNDEQISESSITQHQAALSITESQISDLQNYLTTPFPSGTRMLFQQTTAPTGWTKVTNINNRALRITSGTVGSGGNASFNTVFGITATNSHTLTTSQIPSHNHSGSTSNTGSHTHSYLGSQFRAQGGGGNRGNANEALTRNTNSAGAHSHNISLNNTGGGGGHSHGIDLRVHYVDVIIAVKD